jgi:stage II sporulation protein D
MANIFRSKYFSSIIAILAILLSSCVREGFTSHGLYSGENIKIAILKNMMDLTIEGATAAENDGRSLSFQPSQEGASFTPTIVTLEESGALTVNGSEITGSKIAFSSDNGVLSVNSRTYRGTIEVIKEQKGLLVVNELPLEFYVAGLINQEISSKWPIEVVKAQAVIARTYAMYQKKKRAAGDYHVEATVVDQVYAGNITEDERSLYAVKETIGEILTYNGELALTVYHSNSGGMTEDAKNIWGKDYPYLRQVKSSFDKDSSHFSWILNMSPQSVEAALKDAGYPIADIQNIIPIYTTNSGRVIKVMMHYAGGKLEMSGEDLRKAIGYDKLKSTMFSVEMINGSFVFNGKGHGHGVGLSQWGAKGMAEKGYTYTEILEHFYSGTSIERIY